MAQILDPTPSGESAAILCCYVNVTSKIQIARVTNIPDWYFERVVFPGQRLMFEAPSPANLEIHTGMMASSILSDTIPCTRLAMNAVDAHEDEHEEDATSSSSNHSGTPTGTQTVPAGVGVD